MPPGKRPEVNGLTPPETIAVAAIVSLFITALALRRTGKISYGTTAGMCALAVVINTVWCVMDSEWELALISVLSVAALIYAWRQELGWPLNRSQKRKP